MPSLSIILILIVILINLKSLLDENKKNAKDGLKLKNDKIKENYDKVLKSNKGIQTKPRTKLNKGLEQNNFTEKDKKNKLDKLNRTGKTGKLYELSQREKITSGSYLQAKKDFKLNEVEIQSKEKNKKSFNQTRGKDLILAHELMADPLCKRRRNNKIRP